MSLLRTYEELCGRPEGAEVIRADLELGVRTYAVVDERARAANLLAGMALRARRLQARARGEAPAQLRMALPSRLLSEEPRPPASEGGYGERNNTRVLRATRVRRAIRRLSPEPQAA